MKSLLHKHEPDKKYPILILGWEDRLLQALERSKARGLGGDNSLLSRALIDIGFNPPIRQRRVDWEETLRSNKLSQFTSDFHRYGLPHIAKYVLSYFEEEYISKRDVFTIVDEAINTARQLRKEKRGPSSVDEKAERSESSLISESRLSVHIDNALALLEGALASHNLNAHQRTRLLRVIEKSQMAILSVPEFGSGLMVNSVPVHNSADSATQKPHANGDRLDATHSWGTAFRDNGKFGSHAAFDPMDDESSP